MDQEGYQSINTQASLLMHDLNDVFPTVPPQSRRALEDDGSDTFEHLKNF